MNKKHVKNVEFGHSSDKIDTLKLWQFLEMKHSLHTIMNPATLQIRIVFAQALGLIWSVFG